MSKAVLRVSGVCGRAEQMHVQRQGFLWLRALCPLCPRDMGSATAVFALTSQPRGAATVFSTAKGVLGSVTTSPARKHRT